VPSHGITVARIATNAVRSRSLRNPPKAWPRLSRAFEGPTEPRRSAPHTQTTRGINRGLEKLFRRTEQCRRHVVAWNLRANRWFSIYVNEAPPPSLRGDGVRFQRGSRTDSAYAGNSAGSNSAACPHTHK
jgi:hypothetical protein